ncbi:unnamed protein product [Allacma fusca]|uniref:Uncharacterized protein n=1 Tax=Allacma fusca TaxID=39272 RepID=A0A8J2JZ62_9HEXA|nr:unnamed protein product [Allacma fusca]
MFFIAIYAKLNFIPVRVSQYAIFGRAHLKPFTGAILSTETRRWRLWMYDFFVLVTAIDGFYVCTRFVQSLFVRELFHIEQFPIHFFWGASNLVVQFWTKQSFFTWPGYTIGILRQISTNISTQVERNRPWNKMTRHELLAQYMHLMFFVTGIVMIGVILWDWSRLLLIYSSLPTRYQTELTFFICLAFEIISIFTEISCTSINFYKQVLFFELANNKLQGMIEKVQKSRTTGQQSLKEPVAQLRHLQLLVQCFNQGNCYMIFASKLICLSAPVICGFVAIRFFHADPITGMLCIVLIFNAITCYALIYEKAFLIPANMVALKELIKVSLNARRNKSFSEEITKTLKSIPPIGVRVGSFNTMERSSTLIYISFVTEKLASVLVVTKFRY